MQTCKFCGGPLIKRRVLPHVGVYCVICGRWQQWVGKSDIKFVEVPFEEAAQYIDTDSIKKQKEAYRELYRLKQQDDKQAKIALNSLYGRMACSSNDDSGDSDDTPPWEV